MIPLDSMKEKMRRLGIYTLDGSTLVDAELKAYQAGLAPLCDALAEAKRELCIQTAQTWGLARRERMFGPEKPDLPAADRREMLLARFSVARDDFTRDAIERAVIASGFDVSITERPSEGKIQVNCIRVLSDLTEQEAMKRAASEFLPAHLLWEFDFSLLSWDKVDQMDLSFDQMDGADLTWNQIDIYRE